MLISIDATLDTVFQDLKHELRRGTLDKKHPFRFVVLSTVCNQAADARYVVMRMIDASLNLVFYSDSRTEKVKSILQNPKVSLTCYHPQKRAQVRIQADALIHQGDDMAHAHWSRVQGEAQKAYNSKLAPGTPIVEPSAAFVWEDQLDDPRYFAVIELKPIMFEVLQLNGLEHQRAQFFLKNDSWEGSWIVP
ncbi:pyridoxamine 5'-phosphate oxidase family protein [Mongoliitalea daihaiensis]|uniref:pyridoxamine 5'-phosphate oxidase family protein n=1 Tax=Mongoliitalea daihaiensis TaxID=2782006 RepID=UPI001F1D3FA0|nr:pyridoxamine 5'-phosphate oxidase family protein [Mongoliitalea daihaiensis]UJP65463.1 pyridoxamine 5'-phosphate oxidase family protein [Mongoliitalea daihaiensis]